MSPAVVLLLALGVCTVCEPGRGSQAPVRNGKDAPPGRYTTESIRGRVVWLADALRRLHGVQTDPDAEQWYVALETPQGQVFPIVKDARGRGFLIDERLRGINMELLVRRYEGGMIQVIRVYTIRDKRKYELDYWCDVCAIPMFELKPCECCQGPTRLRERPVEDEGH